MKEGTMPQPHTSTTTEQDELAYHTIFHIVIILCALPGFSDQAPWAVNVGCLFIAFMGFIELIRPFIDNTIED